MAVGQGAVENLVNAPRLTAFFARKRVVVTGHTGFKGAWLSLWLADLGASVSGFALPATEPSLFADLRLERRLAAHEIGDVCDFPTMRAFLTRVQPEIVFHLAAQPLVRHSYVEPRRTFEANLMGVVNLLEAVRVDGGPRVVQIITTDKCYENNGSGRAFCERDPLGGADPYSASKACAELAAAAYRQSFFRDGVSLATVRAGNVIGGGDWAADRLIPDCVRAFQAGKAVTIRNQHATRPWQFVLEPLAGYLTLAERQWRDSKAFAEAWNFGPIPEGTMEVSRVAQLAGENWGVGARVETSDAAASAFHEAPTLTLDVAKAVAHLGWKPVYGVAAAVAATIDWYRKRWSAGTGFSADRLCRAQIFEYQRHAARSGAAWAT